MPVRISGDGTVIGLPLLPSQTGHAGKYLTTDGTAASWAEVAAGGSGEQTGSWIATLGHPDTEESYFYSVAADEHGNIYAGGDHYGGTLPGAEGTLYSWTPDGTQRWGYTVEDATSGTASGWVDKVAAGAGRCAALLGTSTGYAVVNLNHSDGSLIWEWTTPNLPNGIQIGPGGETIIGFSTGLLGVIMVFERDGALSLNLEFTPVSGVVNHCRPYLSPEGDLYVVIQQATSLGLYRVNYGFPLGDVQHITTQTIPFAHYANRVVFNEQGGMFLVFANGTIVRFDRDNSTMLSSATLFNNVLVKGRRNGAIWGIMDSPGLTNGSAFCSVSPQGMSGQRINLIAYSDSAYTTPSGLYHESVDYFQNRAIAAVDVAIPTGDFRAGVLSHDLNTDLHAIDALRAVAFTDANIAITANGDTTYPTRNTVPAVGTDNFTWAENGYMSGTADPVPLIAGPASTTVEFAAYTAP